MEYLDFAQHTSTGLLMAFALLWCAAVALAVMGWFASRLPIKAIRPGLKQESSKYDLDAPHPQSGLFSAACYLVAVWLVVLTGMIGYNSLVDYNRLGVAKDSKTITLEFLFGEPKSFSADQIKAIDIDQEWTVQKDHIYRRFGPLYSCKVIVESKDGKRFESNGEVSWHTLLHPRQDENFEKSFPSATFAINDEELRVEREKFQKFENFLLALKGMDEPLRFTFKDHHGHRRDTEWLIERPGDPPSIPDDYKTPLL